MWLVLQIVNLTSYIGPATCVYFTNPYIYLRLDITSMYVLDLTLAPIDIRLLDNIH